MGTIPVLGRFLIEAELALAHAELIAEEQTAKWRYRLPVAQKVVDLELRQLRRIVDQLADRQRGSWCATHDAETQAPAFSDKLEQVSSSQRSTR